MKILLLLLPLTIFADTFIIKSEKIDSNISTFYVHTICKDNYQYTIIKLLGNSVSIVQDFEKLDYSAQPIPIKCQRDFKHPSQFPKD